MVEILRTHVWKWKNETVETIPGIGGMGIKEKDGGMNSPILLWELL
jgi:hypothetical protein